MIDHVSLDYLDGTARLQPFSVTYWLPDGTERRTTVLAVDRHDAEQRLQERLPFKVLCLAD